MGTPDESAAKAAALARLEACPLDVEFGGAIETFCERYGVSAEERATFERLLSSPSVGNRSAALDALIFYGKFDGYEADAVLLHFDSRKESTSQVDFASISHLRRLNEQGSAQALRIATLLDSDPYVRAMWGDAAEKKTNSPPISRRLLQSILNESIGQLPPAVLLEYQTVAVSPYLVTVRYDVTPQGGHMFWVVAAREKALLLFDDVEEYFSTGALDADGILRTWGNFTDGGIQHALADLFSDTKRKW